MRNKFFCLLATIMMCGAMISGPTSCSDNDDNNSDNQKKVAVLLPDGVNLARWVTDKANLEEVMKAYGFNAAFYVAPESPEGAMQQVEQLKTVINEGVKYIVVTAIDYQKINESGLLEQHPDVKVVCHDRFILDNPRIAYISSADTKEVGRTQAQFLLNHYHSSGAATMTIEILEGPLSDVNAKAYYEGAMELLRKYIDSEQLIVKSGKIEYSQVKSDSWSVADGKKDMKDRLDSYGEGECPDMILAATDNQAQGAIEALEEAGITDMPVITGQDDTAMAQSNIKNGKQTMTINKNLKDMAYNTAMIINSLISNSPVRTSQSISDIPVFYSSITVMTQDSY
ncbi:MAG: substrate-binding domain-containing protein [Bacteroidaceae bacterium]|nr:substrate-binding domain-containing protein [Bacteroidaceae bacterium]